MGRRYAPPHSRALYGSMKILAFIILISALASGSFYLGIQTGIAKRSAMSFADDAKASMDKLSGITLVRDIRHSDEEHQKVLDDREVDMIYRSIVDYGYYLDHWTHKVFDVNNIDAATHRSFKYVIKYYLENHHKPEKMTEIKPFDQYKRDLIAEGLWDPESSDALVREGIEQMKQEKEEFRRAIEFVSE